MRYLNNDWFYSCRGYSAESDGTGNRDRGGLPRGRGRGGRGLPVNSSRFGDKFSAERSGPSARGRGGPRGGSTGGRGDRIERGDRLERGDRIDRGEQLDRDNGVKQNNYEYMVLLA